jgi:hypothetical protein
MREDACVHFIPDNVILLYPFYVHACVSGSSLQCPIQNRLETCANNTCSAEVLGSRVVMTGAPLALSRSGEFDREGVVPLCRYAPVLARHESDSIGKNWCLVVLTMQRQLS